MQTFEVKLTVKVDHREPVDGDDVEWAIRDLFFDDDQGNPNFRIGVVTSIVAEEIENPA